LWSKSASLTGWALGSVVLGEPIPSTPRAAAGSGHSDLLPKLADERVLNSQKAMEREEPKPRICM